MVTSKPINALFALGLQLFISCNPNISYDQYEAEYSNIAIKGWNIQNSNIKSAKITMYKKGTDFVSIENVDSVFLVDKDSSLDKNAKRYYTYLQFNKIKSFPTNKDYILIINNSYEFRISNIHTYTKIRGTGSMKKAKEMNTINSLNINGRYYEMGNLAVPIESAIKIKPDQ